MKNKIIQLIKDEIEFYKLKQEKLRELNIKKPDELLAITNTIKNLDLVIWEADNLLYEIEDLIQEEKAKEERLNDSREINKRI